MLGGSNFLRSDWVNGLRLHQFEAGRFVVMGKVSLVKYKGV